MRETNSNMSATKELTNQEIFSRAYQGLLAQGVQSVDLDHDCCLYRGPAGCRCALGFIIEDEHYDPSIENCGPEFEPNNEGSSLVNAVLVASGVPYSKVTWLLLGDLQSIHDDHKPEAWEQQLQQLVESSGCLYGIKIPESTNRIAL